MKQLIKKPVAGPCYVFMLVSLLLLMTALPVPAAAPQHAASQVDPHPLQPPDTSSPRDTLRAFLTNVDKVVRAWRRGTLDPISDRAWLSATMMLDFSATPDGGSWSVETERILLLKEILERVDVPPDKEIPGDEEVVKRAITKWTIPDTWITIARIQEGPRQGEFLFSAATVEGLYRAYMVVKELPYKPSASTPGIYDDFLSSEGTFFALEKRLRNRLRRVNTASPRSTLLSFLDNMNRAYSLVMDADIALKAQPPTMSKRQALDIEKTADGLLHRATATLDLSRIPEALREAVGIEAALKLKEVIDRTLLPLLGTVPDVTMVAAARQKEDQSSLRAGRPFRWRYPNTEIEIVEVMEGDRQGEFLFSAGTVAQISDFFERVRDLPYMEEAPNRNRGSIYTWAATSKGFYDYYVSYPGYLVPRASFLGRLVDPLPSWFKMVRAGQTVWQWTALLLCALTVVLAVWLIVGVLRNLAGRLNPPLDGWVRILAPTLIMVLVIGVEYFVSRDLNITGTVRTIVTTGSKAIVIIMVIWTVIRLCKAIAETVIASPRIRERSLDASLLRITARIVAFLIGGWIFIVSVRDLGADLVPLLAGLGVGGLAVALAAQRTLANFIGSLILFASKPVKPGDFCRYGDQIGTVEHIGLLSTRIRSLERTIVTVPNAEFSEMKLDNFAQRDQRLLQTVLQLRYETTPEQMRYILAKLRELLLGHPKVTPDPARVRFIGYGSYSKDVEIFAYLRCQDQDTFLAIQEDLLLRMEDIVNEAGSGFAFPSQTAYLMRDKGVDTDRGRAVEAQVKLWRDRGKLPFPEFEDTERERLKDTLDYPPKGSPYYKPAKASAAGQPEVGSSTFSPDDFHDLPSLVAKLQEPNQVANYLWGHLSSQTRSLLSSCGSDAEANREARSALAGDLNAIIYGPSIYAVDRFSQIKLRRETYDLVESNPEGEDLALLNRLLLEDAYPLEFSRNPH